MRGINSGENTLGRLTKRSIEGLIIKLPAVTAQRGEIRQRVSRQKNNRLHKTEKKEADEHPEDDIKP